MASDEYVAERSGTVEWPVGQLERDVVFVDDKRVLHAWRGKGALSDVLLVWNGCEGVCMAGDLKRLLIVEGDVSG